MKNGFTLIELLVLIAIFGIVMAVTIPAIMGVSSNTESTLTFGVTGYTEERCISGFKFVTGSRGAPAQILDAQGHGIPCK